MTSQAEISSTTLQSLFEASASRHRHLCPRQVLGVRMGISAAAILEMNVPRDDKRLIVILETDGCFADGIEVATGCTLGHRTLRIEDYGKVAATFVQVSTGRAIRLAPRQDVRQRAWRYAPPDENRRYFAQLYGYQVMPFDELFTAKEVVLGTPIETILSRPGVRTNCAICGEEIINQREVVQENMTLCQACAGSAYYSITQPETSNIVFYTPAPL